MPVSLPTPAVLNADRAAASPPAACSGWPALLVGLGLVGLIWLLVLPWVARLEPVEQRIRFLESRGIDPSARFYTDQPAVWSNVQHVKDKLAAAPAAFWSWGG